MRNLKPNVPTRNLPFIGVITLSLTCCTTYSPPNIAAPTARQIDRAGNLIIFRANAEPTAWPVKVKVNGIRAGSLAQGEAVAMSISAGDITIEYDWPFLSGQRDGNEVVTISDSRPLFLEIVGSMSASDLSDPAKKFQANSEIRIVPLSQANAALQLCCSLRSQEQK